MRALVADGERDSARSIALSLREHPETDTLGRLAGGVYDLTGPAVPRTSMLP